MKLDIMLRELMVAKELVGGDVEVVFQENEHCSRILDCPALRDVVLVDENTVRLADEADAGKIKMLVFR